MSSGSYNQADIKCPFYLSDDGKRKITCEGIIPGSRIVSTFRGKRKFAAQIERCSSMQYTDCQICDALLKKYSAEG